MSARSAGVPTVPLRPPRGGLADLLGHSSIAITGDIYGHISDDTARAAVDKLSAELGI